MPDGLAALARPSGAFAMLALDQRESLRAMLAATGPGDVPDRALAAFKVDAARALTPHASAVLVDVDFGLGPVREAGAIAPGCALIVAADQLTMAGGGVEATDVDEAVLADDGIAGVADAYKLLVIWRAGREAAARERTVRAFLDGCRARGRPGIVEALVRPGSGGALAPDEHAAQVVEAARELGRLGPDLYKAEVPTLGAADDATVGAWSRRVTEALDEPWVVLSNGVSEGRYPTAVLAACRGGASGFLAGRAIWRSTLAAADTRRELETAAAARLRDLAEAVDAVARPWWEA